VRWGRPGLAKSTQATFLAEHFKIPAISTGDIFRANVSEGTPLGVEAKRFMDQAVVRVGDRALATSRRAMVSGSRAT